MAITVNLVKFAQLEVEFLQHVDSQWELRSEPIIKRAIWRYENFWLPLVSGDHSMASPVSPLVPPIDVHWVWHCHMLCPLQYDKDCIAMLGKRVKHEVPTASVKDYIISKVKVL